METFVMWFRQLAKIVQPGVLCFAIIWAFLVGTSRAEEIAKPSAADLEFFEAKIRPVLVEKCYSCHSSKAEILKGGLRLDSRDGLLNGGDSGTAVVPRHPNASLLIQALRYEGLEMPPSGKLPDDVIADFERWVSMGLPDPHLDEVPAPEQKALGVEAGRRFWGVPAGALTNPTRRQQRSLAVLRNRSISVGETRGEFAGTRGRCSSRGMAAARDVRSRRPASIA